MNAEMQHLETYPTCTNAVLINLQMQALKHTFNFTHITNSASSKNIKYTFVSPSPWIFAGLIEQDCKSMDLCRYCLNKSQSMDLCR